MAIVHPLEHDVQEKPTEAVPRARWYSRGTYAHVRTSLKRPASTLNSARWARDYIAGPAEDPALALYHCVVLTTCRRHCGSCGLMYEGYTNLSFCQE